MAISSIWTGSRHNFFLKKNYRRGYPINLAMCSWHASAFEAPTSSMSSWPRAPPTRPTLKTNLVGISFSDIPHLYELESNACALALGNKGESEPHPHAASARGRRSSEGRKRSVGRDGRRDRIGEGRFAWRSTDNSHQLTTQAPITVGLSRLRLGGRVLSIWRRHRCIEDRNIFLHGECDGFTASAPAPARAHFLSTWSRRTRRGQGWLLIIIFIYFDLMWN